MIFLIAFIDMLGFGLILPQLPFFAQQFNAGPVEIGILASSFPFFQLLASGPWGAAADRYGAKPVLLAGLAGSVAGFLIFGFAGSYAMLVFSRSLAGFCAGNLGVIRALLAAPEDPARNQKNMAWYGGVQGLGFLFGPLISIALIPYSLGAPGLAAAAFSAVSFVLVWRAKLPAMGAHPVKPSESLSVFRDVRIRRVLFTSFVHQFSFALFFIALPLLLQSRFDDPVKLTAMGFMLMAVIGGLAQGLVAPTWMRRFGAMKTWLVFAPLTAVATLGFPMTANKNTLVMVVIVWGFSFALTNPPLLSWVGLLSTEGFKGVIAGAAESAAGLARICGNLSAGFLIAYFGNGSPFVVSAAAMAAALILGWLSAKDLAEKV